MSIKVYAALSFLSAGSALWSAASIVVAGLAAQHADQLLFELLWGAFSVALGFGILRLRPAWRVVALVCCCWAFAVFALVLVAWCIWPHSVTWPVLAITLVAATLNGFFFYRFRQPDIRLLFQAKSAVAPSV